MTENTAVETHAYHDDGNVDAETVLTVGDREFVIVEKYRVDEHEVYEREPGQTRPFKQWAPEERQLESPSDA